MVGSDAVLRAAPCWHCQTAVLPDAFSDKLCWCHPGEASSIADQLTLGQQQPSLVESEPPASGTPMQLCTMSERYTERGCHISNRFEFG